jgi:hypothetical protein
VKVQGEIISELRYSDDTGRSTCFRLLTRLPGAGDVFIDITMADVDDVHDTSSAALARYSLLLHFDITHS